MTRASAKGLVDAKLNEERTVIGRFPGEYPERMWWKRSGFSRHDKGNQRKRNFPLSTTTNLPRKWVTSLAELNNRFRLKTCKKKRMPGRDQKTLKISFPDAVEKNPFPSLSMVEHRTSDSPQGPNQLERQGSSKPNDPQAEAATRDKVRKQAEKEGRLSYC